VLEIDSIAAMKDLVETEDLLAILPYGATHREVADGRIAPRKIIASPPLTALLVVGTALSKPVTKAAAELIHIIKEQVETARSNGLLRGTTGEIRKA
jgi:hypothetical protein